MASASASENIKSLNGGISGKTWAVIEKTPSDKLTRDVIGLLGKNASNIIQNKDFENGGIEIVLN